MSKFSVLLSECFHCVLYSRLVNLFFNGPPKTQQWLVFLSIRIFGKYFCAGMAAQCLPCMDEALALIPGTTKNNENFPFCWLLVVLRLCWLCGWWVLGEITERMLPQELTAALASWAVFQPHFRKVRASLGRSCGFRGISGTKWCAKPVSQTKLQSAWDVALYISTQCLKMTHFLYVWWSFFIAMTVLPWCELEQG